MEEKEQILCHHEGVCVGSWEVIEEVFYPTIEISLSSENPTTIINNSIIKRFSEEDTSNAPCEPYLKDMTTEYTHLPDDQKYFVPYFRMWPSQKEDRIFKLRCDVMEGKGNYATEGDIYIEMPNQITGLSVTNLENNTVKGAKLYEYFTLELLLTKDADRAPTGIDAVPLVLYVENNGEKTEIARIHLSVAPRGILSEGEIELVHQVYKSTIDKTGGDMYKHIGGKVWDTYETYKNKPGYANRMNNTCAIRMSRALNYSIFEIAEVRDKTIKGEDDKNYFLNSEWMYEYLRRDSVFGAAHILSTNNTLKNGIYFQKIGFSNADGHIDCIYNGNAGSKFYPDEGTNYYWGKDKLYDL